VTQVESGALENPFPGLRPFREDEEHLFFGRESQVDRMVDKLAATRFLAVVGTSGSGKSSLVNCGLKPALHRGLMAGAGSTWRMVQFRPGAHPVRSMAQAFAADGSLIPNPQPEAMSTLDIVEATLNMSSLGVAHLYEYANAAHGTNLLLIVDQFEELFRYSKQNADGSTSGEATAFVNLLLEAHAHPEYPIYIVLTMRSDFLGECSKFDGLPEVINEGQYLVPRMGREDRREAIAGPIGVVGADLSPVLLTRMVNDVGENPDQLSILQHSINRTWALWQQQTGCHGELALEQYEAIGTMARALDQHAEEAYAELATDAQKKICERVFKALTDTGTDARGIRRPMTFASLAAVTGVTPEELLPVLNVMRVPSRSFLMPPIAEPVAPDTVIDVSHEILMRVWERLKGWAAEEAQSAMTYRRLAESAELYKAGKEALWRDPGLQTALEWQATEQPNAAWAALYRPGFEQAMSFLAASKRVRDRELAEVEFERRWGLIRQFLLIFVFIVYVVLWVTLDALVNKHLHTNMSTLGQANAGTGIDIAFDFAKKMSRFKVVAGATAAFLSIGIYAALLHFGKRLYRRMVFTQLAAHIASQSVYQQLAELEGLDLPVAQAHLEQTVALYPLVSGSFWQRFAAACIDGFVWWTIVFIVLLLGGICAAVVTALAPQADSKMSDTAAVVVLISMLVAIPVFDWLYQALMQRARWAGTLGELACGLTLVTVAGTRPSFGRISLRYLSKSLYYLTLGVGMLIQPITPRKQSLPDLVTGTLLVRRRRR